jgi:parallel beta-helix repeat protein
MVALVCVGASAAGALADYVIEAEGDVQTAAQEAFILAQPGQIIEFAEGTFRFTRGLSLDVDGVTVRGRGMDKTVLSFASQDLGSEGIMVTSDGVTLRDLAVEDTKGDAIKAKGVDGIYFINVRTEWTGGPKATNGSYGLYPVESSNVLIDGCVAIGASDAGIYVGQSKNIIVRNSRAEYNVAGIEIENSTGADVHDNVATRNTGGILIFDLPDLPVQGGKNVRVFRNKSVDNDTPNFAPPGNIVATVERGTGMMIMANDRVEVFENEFSGNPFTNILIISYTTTGKLVQDAGYDPFPEGVYIYDNTFKPGMEAPTSEVGMALANAVGSPLPDIMWDGAVDSKKFVDDALPPELGIYIEDNGDATFANFDFPKSVLMPEQATIRRDLAAHAGSLPRLEPVVIAGVN